ncbi:MAG: glycosyltransferase family 39 protein, partial [Planctomycetes bacterium]|nr:glycosyltransferase family 39 protein [Planctomycetota bacterium]
MSRTDAKPAFDAEQSARGPKTAPTNSARSADRVARGLSRLVPDRMLRVSLPVVLAVALSARISTVLLYPIIQKATSLSHGSDGYEHIAATLAAGHGYKFAEDLAETMFLPPVYPLFLALLFLFTGPSLLAATVVHSLLDTASCFMVYILGKRHGGHRAGICGSLLYALYPGAWIGCSRYLTEPLFIFLILGFLVFFSGFVRSGGKRGLFAASVLGALAVLCKSVAGALPLFIIVCALFLPAWRHCRRRVLAGLAVCLLVSVVAVVPWVYRNYKVSGSFVYPTTIGGQALYTAHVYATHPQQRIRASAHQAAREMRQFADDHGIRLDPRDSYPRWFYDSRDEVKLDRIIQKIAKDQIASDRVGYVQHIVGNLWRFWWGAPSPISVWISIVVN